MIRVFFAPSFDRLMRKLEPDLAQAVSDVLVLFKNPKNHRRLKVHKLHGHLKHLHAFSIDYRHRVIFSWIEKRKALLLDFGDHSIYE